MEGYTNFAWMVLNAAAITFDNDPLVFSKLAGGVCILILALLPFSSTLFGHLSIKWRFISGILVGTCPSISFYGVSGMETGLFTLAVTIALLTYVKSLSTDRLGVLRVASVAFSVAAFTRPEGVAFLVAAIGFELLRNANPFPSKRLINLCVPFLASWTPYFVWRLIHFGYVFPNTYYAKHTGGGLYQPIQGLYYLSGALGAYLGIALVIILLVDLAGNSPRGESRLELSRVGRLLGNARRFVVEVANDSASRGAAFVVFNVGWVSLYVIVVGGDDTAAFPSFRLLVPILPSLYLTGMNSLSRKAFSTFPSAKVTAVICIVVGAWVPDGVRLVRLSLPTARGQSTALTSSLVSGLDRSILDEPELSAWIRQQGSDSIAIPFVGRVAYFLPDVTVIDTLGLNDLHIAHQPKPAQRGVDTKMDADYVMGRRPNIIIVNVNRRVVTGEMTFEQGGGWKIGDRLMLDRLSTSPDYIVDLNAPGHLAIFRLQDSAGAQVRP